MSDVRIALLTPVTLADAIDQMVEEGEVQSAEDVANWLRTLEHD